MRVLLVEDDLRFGEAVVDALEQDGHVVSWAMCIADALTHMNQTLYDVVLSDYELPVGIGGLNTGKGTAVLNAAADLHPRPKTILWSGLDRSREVAREMTVPPDHVLTKDKIVETLALIA